MPPSRARRADRGPLSNGAIIEREIEFALNKLDSCGSRCQSRLHHRQALASAIKRFHRLAGRRTARPVDGADHIPKNFRGQRDRAAHRRSSNCRSSLISPPRSSSRALRHHRDGRDVRVSDRRGGAGQSHRHHLRTPVVSQPQPFSGGETRVTPRTRVGVQEDGKKSRRQEGVSLQQLVDGLNALGIGPRDLISILQAIKAAGAIQATSR